MTRCFGEFSTEQTIKKKKKRKQATHLDNILFSGLAANPLSKTPWCALACTPKKPFFFTVGSLLLNILDMEKFVELPDVFCVPVPFAGAVSFISPWCLSSVLITGKQVIFRKLSGSGVVFRLLDSGLDTTFTSIASDWEPILAVVPLNRIHYAVTVTTTTYPTRDTLSLYVCVCVWINKWSPNKCADITADCSLTKYCWW